MKYLLTIILFMSVNVFGEDKIKGLYGNPETDMLITCFGVKEKEAIDCANKVMGTEFRLHSIKEDRNYGFITLFLTRK